MTVSTLANKVTYLGNGSATSFAVPFKVLDEDHLVVTRLVTATEELDHTYIGTDFSYSGIGDDAGTLTLDGAALSSTYSLVIERIVPYTQELDLINAGGFYPETVEEQLDLTTMGLQQVANSVTELEADIPNVVDEVQALIDSTVFTVTSAPGQTVMSKTLLAAIASPLNDQTAILMEEGGEGTFKFSTANLSTQVTADPYQGIYVAPAAAPTGASGAWVRVIHDNIYRASWFGFSTSNLATNHLRLRTIEALRPAGSTVVLPSGEFTGFYPSQTTGVPGLSITKAGRWTGAGRATRIGCTATALSHLFSVLTSDVEVDNIRFSDFVTTDNADGQFCIDVGTRHNAGATAGALTDRILIHDIWIEDCDEGIRTIRNTWTGPTFYVPTKVEMWNIHVKNIGYQAFVPWADDVHIHDCDVTVRAGVASRPFQYVCRVLGCNRLRIESVEVYDPVGQAIFGVMVGGVDSLGGAYGAQYNDANHVTIRNVRGYGIGGMASILTQSGWLIFENCYYDRDISRTDEAGAFSFGGGTEPMRQGHIVIKGGAYRGFTNPISGGDSNFKRLSVDDVEFVGNARTAALSSTYAVSLSNNPSTGLLDQAGAAIIGFQMVEVTNCKFLLKDSLYTYCFRVDGSAAGSWFNFAGNRVPYGANLAAAHTNPGSGTLTSDPANVAYPAGIFATHIANIASNPRATNY